MRRPYFATADAWRRVPRANAKLKSILFKRFYYVLSYKTEQQKNCTKYNTITRGWIR